MSIFLNPGGCCGCGGATCNATFIARGCNSGALTDATVSLYTDSSKATLVATGTTSGGSVVLNVGAAGTYWRVISRARFTTSESSVAVTCGGTYTTTLSPTADYVCSLCCTSSVLPQPRTLYLTDADGTHTLTFATTGSQDYWHGCHTKTVNAVIDPGSPCTNSASGSILISYQARCSTGTNWVVTRLWCSASTDSGLTYRYLTGGTCGSITLSCNTSCNLAGTDGASASPLTISCSSISWSGSLTASGGNRTTDPVGGTVTLSE
jgi:hypothetical protein